MYKFGCFLFSSKSYLLAFFRISSHERNIFFFFFFLLQVLATFHVILNSNMVVRSWATHTSEWARLFYSWPFLGSFYSNHPLQHPDRSLLKWSKTANNIAQAHTVKLNNIIPPRNNGRINDQHYIDHKNVCLPNFLSLLCRKKYCNREDTSRKSEMLDISWICYKRINLIPQQQTN